MPHSSKSAFLNHGLANIILHTALDCSICREPLAVTLEVKDCPQSDHPAKAVINIGHASIDVEDTDDRQVSNSDSRTAVCPENVEPEQAVRIVPCDHTFGRTCLEAWFNTSESNTCPECNQELFPRRHIKLFFRQPTRSMRLGFAMYIEQMTGDLETAAQIRERLMSEWTRLLIREFAMENLRQQGFHVEYEYVDDTVVDEEEAETDIEEMSEEKDGVNDEDNTDEDDTDEMDTDDGKIDAPTRSECGFVKKA